MAAPVPVLSPKMVLHLFLNVSFLALILFYVSIHHDISHASVQGSTKIALRGWGAQLSDGSTAACHGVNRTSKAVLLNPESSFSPQGYINYLYIFYCVCGNCPVLGYTVLLLWLLVLFYLLADTSANYFCTNLEGLSVLLKLPPTIAGVTLLSLGNGAPDAFSSIVSFMGKGSGAVGLNSVLGGAFFVSCVVVGVLSICVSSQKSSIDKSSFIRDLIFFLCVLLALIVILAVGKINLWGAIAYTSLYAVYVILVATEYLRNKDSAEDLEAPLLKAEEEIEIAPISEPDENHKSINAAVSSNFKRVVRCLNLPLSIPRRLTIPDVNEERWSKPCAVASATLAPLLLAVLIISKRKKGAGSEASAAAVSAVGAIAGLALGTVSFLKTEAERPPSRFLLPWLAAGFLMSVAWTYIIAQELISLLVSIGAILEISAAVLGLTVLAWGNSIGDLISCLAVALHDRKGGAQVALTGCYAGPIFNTLVGLGLSFLLSAWSAYPSHVLVMPEDASLFQTLGFMIGGLLWALLILPRRGMALDAVLGSGLLAIYLCSLSLRIIQYLGMLKLH